MDSKGFRITGGKGFHITFANGFTVSVQFGPGNYCDNYHDRISPENAVRAGEEGSNTAECAVWSPTGDLIPHFNGESVSNRSTPGPGLGAAELGGRTDQARNVTVLERQLSI